MFIVKVLRVWRQNQHMTVVLLLSLPSTASKHPATEFPVFCHHSFSAKHDFWHKVGNALTSLWPKTGEGFVEAA